MTHKPGDVMMIFGNPVKCENPIGLARLKKLLLENGQTEEWVVEYLDDEEHYYNALIKKENGEKTT